MKRLHFAAGVGLSTLILCTPAFADHGHGHEYHGRGWGFPGFFGGLVAGAVITDAIVGPRPYYYYSYPYYPNYVVVAPDPVVVQPSPAPVVYQEPVAAPSVRMEPSRSHSFRLLGHDWAKDLREDVATRDQFIDYLKANVTKASNEDYEQFRKGFVAAYGVNGEAAFDKAFQQARAN